MATAGIDAVPAQDHPVAATQVNIVLLVSNDIPGDRPQSRGPPILPTVQDPDIGPTGRLGGLDCVRGHRKLVHTGSLRSGIDINLARRLRFRPMRPVIIILDIIARDLEVPHLGPLDSDSSHPVVADVAVRNVYLVQIHPVQKDAHASIEVEVAVTDQNVAIASMQADPMTQPAKQATFNHCLHRLDQLDPIRFRVPPLDNQVPD